MFDCFPRGPQNETVSNLFGDVLSRSFNVFGQFLEKYCLLLLSISVAIGQFSSKRPGSSSCTVSGFFYPAVRTGSSNTHFFPVLFFVFFFGGHLPQTSAFRSAKQILVVSFATQARAFILSDRNIFYTPPGGGEQRRGLMPLGLFLLLSKEEKKSKRLNARA